MLARLRHPDLRPVVAALFAIAMVWLGLGHQPVRIGPGGPAGPVVLVAAPDGSPAELCALSSDGTPSQATHAGRCDACVLAVAPAPAAVAALGVPAVEGLGPVVTARLGVEAWQRPPRPPSRAPPRA